MAQHTPGPWIWRGKSGSLHRVGEPPYPYGARVLAPTYEYDSGVDTEVSDADACLIAAAPDLLAALRAMVAEFEKFSRYGSPIARDANEAMRAARSAIARATGETR
jgi:hypothetical protein